MTAPWRTVRVFISSTFRDMHAERDHLVRVVFPELREWCRTRYVHLVDVDLRWGVTEEDAREGLTLDICLDEIDTCRPYFLGLLGHRYGWVPEGDDQSITSREIYYALLHGYLPRQLADVGRMIDEPPPGGLTQAEQACLVKCYYWSPERGKYLLAASLSAEQRQTLHAVFARISTYQRDRSFVFFRRKAFTRRLAGNDAGDFFETDPDRRRKLATLRREIRAAGLRWFIYGDLETLGGLVLEILQSRIEAEIGRAGQEERDWLSQEDEQHTLFAAQRVRHFVGRRAVLDRLHAFAAGTEAPGILVVTATPGCGKSALLARFADETRERHPEWLIIPHFVGASAASTSLREALRRLCEHLRRETGTSGATPHHLRGLLEMFPRLLGRTGADRRLVIVLDAVNQFDPWDNAQAMNWLPMAMPENTRLVMSVLPGAAQQAMVQRAVTPVLLSLEGLAPSEAREFVDSYLAEIRHAFPNRTVAESFFEKIRHGNPLYIRVALEELRVVPRFEDVPSRVAALPTDTIELFCQVLRRIEGDYPAAPQMVRDFMVLLACLRRPMTPTALQALLSKHAPRLSGPEDKPKRLPDFWWRRLYRSFQFYLFDRGGVIDFFHGQLKVAVERYYLQDEAQRVEVHSHIADFYLRWQDAPDPHVRPYALRFLVFHLIQARRWDDLAHLLADVEFLEAARQEGCTPAALMAEAVREDMARGVSETATQVERLVKRLLATDTEATGRVAVDICTELEWIDLLVEAAQGRSVHTGMWACVGLFAVYSRRLHRGDERGAWEGVRKLRARTRGRLGLPRPRATSALIGLLVTIYVECAENPSQLRNLIEQAQGAAREILFLGRTPPGWRRSLQRILAHFVLSVLRPGVSLAITGLQNTTSAVNLATAQAYFKQGRKRREVLRAYFPYLEPEPRDLTAMADLVMRYCTVYDAFHYNLILGCIPVQGLVQPKATLAILRDMAAKDEPIALYEATRGLYYILCGEREADRVPSSQHEDLMVEWLERYYSKSNYRLDLGGSRVPGRSLAEHVGLYVAKYDLSHSEAFDRLVRSAFENDRTTLQQDLIGALGIVGQHGGYEFALGRLAPVAQGQHSLHPDVRNAVIEALSRMYFHWPQAVSEWMENLAGCGIRLEEVVQRPIADSSFWRGGSEQILRRVLLYEPDMRAVLHRLLDGLPRARSLPGYIQYTARVLLDLLIDEQVPPNPYSSTPRPAS